MLVTWWINELGIELVGELSRKVHGFTLPKNKEGSWTKAMRWMIFISSFLQPGSSVTDGQVWDYQTAYVEVRQIFVIVINVQFDEKQFDELC